MSTLLGTILADFTTSLSTELAVGGTSATLSTATDDDSVALPSGRYFFTLDGSNSNKEHISCDLSGTALTNIKSLSRQGVETTGVARKHRIGCSVSLTDFGHIKFINDLVAGTTNLNSTTPLGYDGAPASLTGNQLATVTYVLGVVNGGAVTFDQQIISAQTSGEALTINDVVYFKESDARWYKVDADLTATFDGLQMGINKTTAAGAAVTIQVAISGPVSGFSGLTAGSKYYASNTAGAISTSAGTYSVFVGWALTTTILLFTPFVKTLPTQKEKDALVGSQGVPSSTNKYLTQDNQSADSTDQSQLTQNATVEFGEADATLKKNEVAQSFIPSKTKIRGVNFYKSADTGTFTGTVTVSLYGDSGSDTPAGVLADVTFTNYQWAALAVGANEAIFSSEYTSLVSGTKYWIRFTTSSADNSNHPNIGTNTAGGYSSGSVKYRNTTDGWVAISTIDLYFSTLEGNISQVVKTNASGKIESAFYDVTELPTPAFFQDIGIDQITTGNLSYAFGSNKTGSVFYLILQGNTGGAAPAILHRFQRDSITGQYMQTHTLSTASAIVPTGDTGGMIVIGDYMYLFSNNATNIVAWRFLAADLTGETAMTVPTVACTNELGVWTDGAAAYVVSQASDTTSRKWSLSGTTFTAVSTATVTTNIFERPDSSTMFDGTTAYYYDRSATTGTIQKLTAIDGSSRSTTTKIIPLYSDTEVGGFILNIDPTRIYLGLTYNGYDETAKITTRLVLFPVTKP